MLRGPPWTLSADIHTIHEDRLRAMIDYEPSLAFLCSRRHASADKSARRNSAGLCGVYLYLTEAWLRCTLHHLIREGLE